MNGTPAKNLSCCRRFWNIWIVERGRPDTCVCGTWSLSTTAPANLPKTAPTIRTCISFATRPASDDFVCTPCGTPMPPVPSSGAWRPSDRSRRHRNTTRAIERGVMPKVLQRLLGHASIKTTMDRYVHVTDISLVSAVKQFEQAAACAG